MILSSLISVRTRQLICPHCGVATAFSPVEHSKKVQRNSAGDWKTVHLSTGSIIDLVSDYFFGTSRCQSCMAAFPVRGKNRNDDDPDRTAYLDTIEPLWPTRFRTVPPEIPSPVREAMEDASTALGAGSLIGSMLAARTALVRAQRLVKIEMKLKKSSLKALLDAGRISRVEFDLSDLARRWANYLGHEEPDSEKTFVREDAEELYGYVEMLLDTLFVKWSRAQESRERLRGDEISNKASAK